jgi:hypothetical protein
VKSFVDGAPTMFDAARTWALGFIARRLYNDWALPLLLPYVDAETAYMIMVSTATFIAFASVRFLVQMCYRATVLVAHDCVRVVYIGVIMLAVVWLSPLLVANTTTPPTESQSWFKL